MVDANHNKGIAMTENKVPEYHQSAINLFLKCQRQYMYRYEMDIQIPPKSALIVGRAVDDSNNFNMEQKIESKIDLPVGDALDAYNDSFEKNSPGTNWGDDDIGKIKDKGYQMSRVVHEQCSPHIQPAKVQSKFRVEFDEGFAIGGTLDVEDVDDYVRDLKTSKANYAEDAIMKGLQPVMYDFAFEATNGKKAKGFIFDIVTKHKEPRYQKLVGQITPHHREWMFNIIRSMHTTIKAGNYQYASESGWWCSAGWCGYWDLCKGKK